MRDLLMCILLALHSSKGLRFVNIVSFSGNTTTGYDWLTFVKIR